MLALAFEKLQYTPKEPWVKQEARKMIVAAFASPKMQ
jgi:hypothetical protein